jgi:hypothetical protein
MPVHRFMGHRTFALLAIVAFVSTTASAQGTTGHKQGKGGSVVRGSAGTNSSSGDSRLEHCDKPMGVVAVVEPSDFVLQALSTYRLGSPVGLIRLMIQQSRCFIVVERGLGMQNALQERALASSGELRQNSNVGGGQMITADFILTPAVVFSEGDAGGVGTAVAGLLGGGFGAFAGSLRFKEAQTSMLLADARSTVQVAAAEGSTRKTDFSLDGWGWGAGVGAAAGGYGNTDEGKIIAAALMDNFNKIVNAVRADPALQRSVGSLAQEAGAGGKIKAGAVFTEGDVVIPKIANIKMLAQPADDAPAVATLARTDELVVIGVEKDGFVNVQGATATGWVKSVLIANASTLPR